MRIRVGEEGNLIIPGCLVKKLGEESEQFECLAERGRLIIRPAPGLSCQTPDKPADRSGPAKSLKIQCFGRLAIYLDGVGQDILIRSPKARELLAYLVCCQGEAVPKRTVCEALWGEISGRCSQDSLYKLIKKVRRLPLPLILEDSRGLLRLDMENIETDLQQFNELLKNKNDIGSLKKAVRLYRGSLLGRENYGWVEMLEADYDRRYLETLICLEQFYEEREDAPSAAVYKRLLQGYI